VLGSMFNRLKSGLQKTKVGFVQKVKNLLRGNPELNEELFAELEEILISADVGASTSIGLVEKLQKAVDMGELKTSEDVLAKMRSEIESMLAVEQGFKPNEARGVPTIIFVVGVNGVGKTTTIAKLSHRLQSQGQRVLLAAGDTFRAAAIEQLREWAKRLNVDVISQQTGSDPAAVVYDAIQALKARKLDVLIIDTAGRLHTKSNLMEELKKMYRIIKRECPQCPVETLLVLDATTGQNGLAQARVFQEAVELTGVVLTKLDGTAKGGIVIPICKELGVPVKYIGLGEGLADLQEFSPAEFVEALFAETTA
jgi:fused signal recognition particle receptor